MKKNQVLTLALLVLTQVNWAFCGFYVAKADATLFNNKSQVIMVRDGDYNVITMSSDFKGDVKDFAMVVPVPVVIKKEDVRVVDRGLFDRLDSYSSPRLVEYWDNYPCMEQNYEEMDKAIPTTALQEEVLSKKSNEAKPYGVHIEATYSVGEYDILVLSAKESDGLRRYLLDNGYRIPDQASRILEPYIKSNTKFFVVKVNLKEWNNQGTTELRPLQMSFRHAKFMLPLRLGMANSQGTQDMIIYAFTRTGRVECTNYRTVKMATDRNIPLFVQPKFGPFYKRLFDKMYVAEGRNAVFLEYAWNVTPSWGGMKCDPCVGPPPLNQDFTQAGVNWYQWNAPQQVFFTRLHVRYDRAHFPVDLQFQVTPNQEHFQARYILTHPAHGDFSCPEGQAYLEELYNRRRRELQEYTALTGWTAQESQSYLHEFLPWMNQRPEMEEMIEQKDNGSKRGGIAPERILVQEDGVRLSGWTWQQALGLVALVMLLYMGLRKPKM